MEEQKEFNQEEKEIKHAVIGINRDEYNKLPVGSKKMATETVCVFFADGTVCVFFADGTVEIYDFSTFDSQQKLDSISAIDYGIKQNIVKKKHYETLYSDSKDFEKIYAKALKIRNATNSTNNVEDDYKDSKMARILTAAGLAGIAGLIGLGACHIRKNNEEDKEEQPEIIIDVDNSKLYIDMTGKDFLYYSQNALPTDQKTNMLSLNNFVSKNGSESWAKTILTEEQMKQYNITDSNAVFGFTAEEAFALSLRFGHYTNDQYVTLMGGSDIDVVSVIDSNNSLSNNALENIISYYICSDECNLNIYGVINFNEFEQTRINEFESMLAEWKELAKDETKEKEAFAKMKEIKEWFNEFAYIDNPELNNVKSFLLRTGLPACSILSQIYQYKDTVNLELYDTTKDVYTTKKVKTALFDELMMRDLVTGFKDFDEEKFLKEINVSSSRYVLNLSEKLRSVADRYCDSEIQKLYQANDYINKLRTENTLAEASYQGSITINPESDEKLGDQVSRQLDNVTTKYDELIDGTYPADQLLEMINNSLKEKEIYPQNINYFRTAKLSELNIEYNKTHGVTRGEKGDKITTKEELAKPVTPSDLSKPNTVVVDQQNNVSTPEQVIEEAKQENEQQTGIFDVTGETEEERLQKEAEAAKKAEEEYQRQMQERASMLQNVYEVTYNYIYTGNVNGYDTNWANSGDAEVVNRHNQAKADAEERKRIEAEVNSFNQQQNEQQPTIDQEIKEVEITEQPVISNDNTTQEEVTNDSANVVPEEFTPVVDSSEIVNDNTQGDIIIDPEFAGAEIYSLDELGLTEEEWDMLILPPEEVMENGSELTGPTK